MCVCVCIFKKHIISYYLQGRQFLPCTMLQFWNEWIPAETFSLLHLSCIDTGVYSFFIDDAFMVPSSLLHTWERGWGTWYRSSALQHIWLNTSNAVRDARWKLTQCRLNHLLLWTQS